MLLTIAKKPMWSLSNKKLFCIITGEKKEFKLVEFGYAVCATLKFNTVVGIYFQAFCTVNSPYLKIPPSKNAFLNKIV